MNTDERRLKEARRDPDEQRFHELAQRLISLPAESPEKKLVKEKLVRMVFGGASVKSSRDE